MRRLSVKQARLKERRERVLEQAAPQEEESAQAEQASE